ncbi:MAG: BlaI/MecI/CopY family transcriptional regulator [Planctomycetota bacterium]
MGRMSSTETLSPGQLEIMNVIWERREASVADVWDVLRARRPVARNTVLTHMTRLEERGWLVRRAVRNSFVYSAATERKQALGGIVSRLVRTVFAGSASGLVAALVDGENLTSEETTRIRKLIDTAEKGRKRA